MKGVSDPEYLPGWAPLETPTLPGTDPDQLIDVSVRLADPAAAVLSVAGEIDMATAPVLRDGVDAVLRPAVDTAVVDLSGVSFLASAGLTVLLDARRAAGLRQIGLRLVATQRPVLRALEVAGIDEMFDRHPSVAQALGQRPGDGVPSPR